eukprot:gene3292-6523_t
MQEQPTASKHTVSGILLKMSVPLFKDIEKGPKDIIDEDYDCKNVMKIKSSGPFGMNFTTSTEHKPTKGGKGNLAGKVSFKWAPSSGGFSVDKFEVKPDGAIAIETSLVDVTPGLKLEFKGDDSGKGDLSMTYKTAIITSTAELDLVEFSKVKSSFVAKSGPFIAGANAAVDLPSGNKDKFDLSVIDVAASCSLPNNIFAAVKSSKKLAEFNFSLSYGLAKHITIASLFTFAPGKGLSALTLGGLYKCNPSTAMKFKLNTAGIVSASVKQVLDKNASAIFATEVDVANVSAFKFGVTTTLG